MVTLTTGQTVVISGIYQVRGTNYQVTLSRGDRVPPYNGRAATFVLVVSARHEQ
ncbi:MAG: hypothetical protein ABSE18_04500 [Minisyncoccia bacterium]|jgi:hypothetical protein